MRAISQLPTPRRYNLLPRELWRNRPPRDLRHRAKKNTHRLGVDSPRWDALGRAWLSSTSFDPPDSISDPGVLQRWWDSDSDLKLLAALVVAQHLPLEPNIPVDELRACFVETLSRDLNSRNGARAAFGLVQLALRLKALDDEYYAEDLRRTVATIEVGSRLGRDARTTVIPDDLAARLPHTLVAEAASASATQDRNVLLRLQQRLSRASNLLRLLSCDSQALAHNQIRVPGEAVETSSARGGVALCQKLREEFTHDGLRDQRRQSHARSSLDRAFGEAIEALARIESFATRRSLVPPRIAGSQR